MNGFKHGRGIYKYASGDLYEGDYQFDLKHGNGKMLFATGDEYVGQWERDEFHGKGRYTFNQKDSLNGQFKNGKFMSLPELLEEHQQMQAGKQGLSQVSASKSVISSPARTQRSEMRFQQGAMTSPAMEGKSSRANRRKLEFS